MSIHGQKSRKARARAAQYDAERENKLLLLALLGGGILIAAATLGRLLLMSPWVLAAS